MKQLAKVICTKVWYLFKYVLNIAIHLDSSVSRTNPLEEEQKGLTTQLDAQPAKENHQNTFKINQNLKDSQQSTQKSRQYKKASLFNDGKTNKAVLSLVMRGVAEVLSQKMHLHWKTEANSILNYEKEADNTQEKIFYYITDNPETPQPETLIEETALNVIEQFDPRACAIHLIYCALTANLEKPWEESFVIDDKQLLDYTGLAKRRDLCRHKKLSLLYHLLQQPAQILVRIAWPKQGEVGAFTVADLKVWDITILRDYKTDKDGDTKLVGLKVIGKPGAWAKYFLKQSEYYRHTGIISKKTVQKLFSIGKQNAGAARILVWLTFQIQPGFADGVSGKTLMEIAYGIDKVSIVEQDRQLRRQMADDFETDLKVVKDAGWQVQLNQSSVWLTSNNHGKRPIGYWNQLLNTKLHFQLPMEVQECLAVTGHYNITPLIEKNLPIQPPSGNVIREARKAKGWSRAFFAQTMGKSVSWVDAVETGHRCCSQKDLPKLFDELDISSLYLDADLTPLPPFPTREGEK
ncbi:MAG: helix-turn-helix transcriptional regulator [Scytonematopsis contorta HA4267-MV1]|jgi:DNA-binding transcriptional regulator YiaG|nr:helix-turn-helix transcriptional regulator [Scytonematopsis contorta HA4267-MV1]